MEHTSESRKEEFGYQEKTSGTIAGCWNHEEDS
jgi:hypothetical protein